MPVRSLNSPVLKWPDARTVYKALVHWAQEAVRQSANVVRVGYFGSYARKNAGPGSDLDVVIIVETSDKPFERRAANWDLTSIPVPVDVIVYTCREWQNLDACSRMARILTTETVWLDDIMKIENSSK